MSSRDSYKANVLYEAMLIVEDDPDLGHDFCDCPGGDGMCDACKALLRASRRLGRIVASLRPNESPAAAVAAGVQ